MILKAIREYATFCDEHGDEENLGYKLLENNLHQLTGKDMSAYNLWKWWEEEGAEVLAFRIALPKPKKVNSIKREEVHEIAERLKNFYYYRH
ncbi:MAG: hypothetical protein ABI266_07285 [Ginsengibacter sp.]